MATVAGIPRLSGSSDNRFFLWSAVAMATVIVAGFSLNIVMGRSSFGAPPLVHAHAIVFMGWVAIYVTQNVLVASGNTALHRRLGWVAVVWIPLMLVLGCSIIVAVARQGTVPFFFQPQQFLIFNPLTMFGFAALSGAAIVLRRRTDWHRRLHLAGLAMIMGPGFGRLLPMPLLIPHAFDIAFACGAIFPLAGIIADWRRDGRVHPAWAWGLGAMAAVFLIANAITHSPLGDRLYAAAVAGSPGAGVPGLAFPPMPGPMPG